jgi:hypothetical protein
VLLPAGTALKITGVLPQGGGLTSTPIRHAPSLFCFCPVGRDFCSLRSPLFSAPLYFFSPGSPASLRCCDL